MPPDMPPNVWAYKGVAEKIADNKKPALGGLLVFQMTLTPPESN